MVKKWWMEAVGYQIYPRSFQDTNDDGIGDLNGIIQRLDYIRSLGANMIWICPFYDSPMDDNGYDVRDFFQVAPEFGTIEDAFRLFEEAHLRGMKVILDLVLNHTSDEHAWFMESRASKDNPKRDYYIWKDPKIGENGESLPPTNWASFFEGSCWNLDPQTNQYYMKIFSNKMPDLNWDNPTLRQELYQVAKWWLDHGADGFRVDAIAHISRDQTWSDGELKSDQKYSSEWSKFSNRPEVHTYLKEMNKEVFSKYDIMTVGEFGGDASTEDALQYCGFDSHELNMAFTFDHCWENGAFGAIEKSDEEIKTNVRSLKSKLDKWQRRLYGKAWNALYWLNHDHPRVMSQYGNPLMYPVESGKMLCNTLYCMWGTPFVYNGEEIGMVNVQNQSFDQFKDVWVKGLVEDTRRRGIPDEQVLRHLNRTSRDNARTPMQWSSEGYVGFSSVTPWISLSGDPTITVASQTADPKSLLNHYRGVLRLRQPGHYQETIVYGQYEPVLFEHPDIIAYRRFTKKQAILVVSNFTSHPTVADLSDYKLVHVINHNYLSSIVLDDQVELQPYESFVVEVKA